jgi:succinate dehydrogenase / fumarate reductase flavoprotein subunit
MVMLERCGMSRTREGLDQALAQIRELKNEFWSNLKVPGGAGEFNQELEKAGRVADYFELAELMCLDAREREESCGGHFREEYQTDEGEALRNDQDFCHVAVWQYAGEDGEPVRHVEPLEFESVQLATRSYK